MQDHKKTKIKMENKPDPRQIFASYNEYMELKTDVHDLARLGVEQSALIFDVAHELTKAKAELTVLKVTVIVILALIVAIAVIFGGTLC